MMDRFAIDQVSTKEILGDENVLEDIPAPDDARVGRYADHDIPCLVTDPAALPMSI
jgi:hypothetical protein